MFSGCRGGRECWLIATFPSATSTARLMLELGTRREMGAAQVARQIRLQGVAKLTLYREGAFSESELTWDRMAANAGSRGVCAITSEK